MIYPEAETCGIIPYFFFLGWASSMYSYSSIFSLLFSSFSLTSLWLASCHQVCLYVWVWVWVWVCVLFVFFLHMDCSGDLNLGLRITCSHLLISEAHIFVLAVFMAILPWFQLFVVGRMNISLIVFLKGGIPYHNNLTRNPFLGVRRFYLHLLTGASLSSLFVMPVQSMMSIITLALIRLIATILDPSWYTCWVTYYLYLTGSRITISTWKLFYWPWIWPLITGL